MKKVFTIIGISVAAVFSLYLLVSPFFNANFIYHEVDGEVKGVVLSAIIAVCVFPSALFVLAAYFQMEQCATRATRIMLWVSAPVISIIYIAAYTVFIAIPNEIPYLTFIIIAANLLGIGAYYAVNYFTISPTLGLIFGLLGPLSLVCLVFIILISYLHSKDTVTVTTRYK